MPVIIDEMEAHVESAAPHESGGEGEPRPTEEQQKQSVLDLIELSQERKTRLGID